MGPVLTIGSLKFQTWYQSNFKTKDWPVKIVLAQTRAHWRDFHRLPYRIYKSDPHWVPPLLLERRLHFSARHNPYFQHARASFWLAYRDGEPVGRISAQIDRLHLDRYSDHTGHF